MVDFRAYQDDKYRKFQSKLIVSKYEYIGVRIPNLRKIAKNIDTEIYISNFIPKSYEDIIVYGILIANIKDPKRRINLINGYLKYIDCWSICDTFCSNLKFIKEDLDTHFLWILSYLESDKTFYIRFGLVMLLKYYQDKKYFKYIYDKIKMINNNEYYCEMAIAWLLCEMAVIDKKYIDRFIENLSPNIQKMYLRKIKDSYKIKE